MSGIQATVAEADTESVLKQMTANVRPLCGLPRKYVKPQITLFPHLSCHNLMPFFLIV